MDFLQLKYFQDVATTENISYTAKKFMVPPSCISIYIKKLEEELQVSLFDRTANRLKLNSNGKLFLAAVTTAFTAIDTAKDTLANLSDAQSGEIRILMDTNRKVITNFVSKFQNDYPYASFIIEHKRYSDYKNYDIIISDQMIESDLFDRKLLVKEEIKLAVPRTHRFARYRSVAIEDLSNEKFVCMQTGSSLRNYTDNLCRKHGFVPNIVVESDDPYYIREYVSLGLGIAFVPTFSWKNLFPDNIQILPLKGPSIYRETNVYTKKASIPIVKIFSNTLNIL